MSLPSSHPHRRARVRAAILLALVGSGLLAACGAADRQTEGADPPASHDVPTLLPHKPRPTLPPLRGPSTTTPPPSRVAPRTDDTDDTATAHYAVGLTTLEFSDTTRPSAARGPTAAAKARSFVVTVRYPAGGPTDAPEGKLDPARTGGPFPMVVFAHDTGQSATRYDQLLHRLSAAGYVVVAPDFPLTSSALDGPADQSDVVNQPADVKFLISKFLTANDQPGVLNNLIATDKIAVAGHADGGVTAAATGYNSCCTDSRVKAVIGLSTAEALFPATWFTTPSGPAYLGVHGDKDTVTPLEQGQSLYASAPRPHSFVTIAGGDHDSPYTDGPEAPSVGRLMAEFLDAQLKGDATSTATFADDANQAPFQVETEG